MEEGRPVSSTRTVMSQLMQPNDANFMGKVFGGTLLALIDVCAYTAAARFSGEVCVTASFDRVDFLEPIDVGDVVTLEGVVTYAGRTSVEVTITVRAENPIRRADRSTNLARVTMVAVKDGRPTPVPKLICETREDKVAFLQGKLRRELRQEYREERERMFREIEEMSNDELDRRLVA